MEIFHISYLVVLIFLLIAIIVYKGFEHQLKRNFIYTSKPNLSVIIAAKDEANKINSLIDSLELLNYPNENFEIIFVNDNSTDETAGLIQSRISGKNNFTLLTADRKTLEGKKGALKVGVDKAKNNFVVITDADCRPENNWLNEIAAVLDYGHDFVFGVAPIQAGGTLVEKLSAFENLRNTYLTISAVGLNIPHSAAARSFGFRKTSYYKLGGYSNTTETLSGDDDLLLREAVKNKMLIGTVVEPDAFVYSSAPKTFTEYFKQKKRHLQTSFHYLLKQQIFLGFWHLVNLLSILSILFVFITPVFAFPFAVKLIFDFFIVIKYQHQLGHSFRFYEIIYLQILFEVFIVFNFFNSLSGKTEWK